MTMPVILDLVLRVGIGVVGGLLMLWGIRISMAMPMGTVAAQGREGQSDLIDIRPEVRQIHRRTRLLFGLIVAASVAITTLNLLDVLPDGLCAAIQVLCVGLVALLLCWSGTEVGRLVRGESLPDGRNNSGWR